MKIIYDDKGRVTEVIGSGENGELTKQDLDIFKVILERRIGLEETKSETPDTDGLPCEIDRCICDIDDNTKENSSFFGKRALMKDFYESQFYRILKEIMYSDNTDKVKCKVTINEQTYYIPVIDFNTGIRVICIDTEIDRFNLLPLLIDRKLPFPFPIRNLKHRIKTRVIYDDICRECPMITASALTKLIVEETPTSSNSLNA